MSTLFMIFILPIGILTYYWDRKNYAENIEVFRSYAIKISNSDFCSPDKIRLIDEMLYQNGYIRTERTEYSLKMQKKHFNIGVLFIYVGLFSYFGFFIFWAYYRFFLKPKFVCIDLNASPIFYVE